MSTVEYPIWLVTLRCTRQASQASKKMERLKSVGLYSKGVLPMICSGVRPRLAAKVALQ